MRDMDWKHLAETVSRMDAVFGGDTQSMSLILYGTVVASTGLKKIQEHVGLSV